MEKFGCGPLNFGLLMAMHESLSIFSLFPVKGGGLEHSVG